MSAKSGSAPQEHACLAVVVASDEHAGMKRQHAAPERLARECRVKVHEKTPDWSVEGPTGRRLQGQRTVDPSNPEHPQPTSPVVTTAAEETCLGSDKNVAAPESK